ncbi:MAG: hypothetical protein QW197_03510 [Candidatus Aenigmatarchaeota archaeon]
MFERKIFQILKILEETTPETSYFKEVKPGIKVSTHIIKCKFCDKRWVFSELYVNGKLTDTGKLDALRRYKLHLKEKHFSQESSDQEKNEEK